MMPTQMGDLNLQQTIELLTRALSRAGYSRDLTLPYADQARRFGVVDYNGEGDPAIAKE